MKKINKKTLTVSLAIIAAVCVIFGIVLLLASPKSGGSANIANGSFESLDSSGLIPKGWEYTSYLNDTSVSNAVVVQDAARGNVVKLTNAELDDAHFTQTVSVQANTIYKLSCYIKTENVSGGAGANIALEDRTCYSTPVLGTTDWTMVELVGKTGSGQSKLKVGCRLGNFSSTSMGIAYFDDFKIEKLTSYNGEIQSFETKTPSSQSSDNTTGMSDAEYAARTKMIVIMLCIYILLPIAIYFLLKLEKSMDKARKGDPIKTPAQLAPSIFDTKPVIPQKTDTKLHYTKKDWIFVIALTLVYGILAVTNLGSTKAPDSEWKGAPGTTVTLTFDDTVTIGSVWHDGGITGGSGSKGTTVFKLTGDDGKSVEIDQRFGTMYRWVRNSSLHSTTKNITLTVVSGEAWINELAFFDTEGNLLHVTVNDASAAALVDEQDCVPEYPSYMTGMYFDELYHARTAYEHLHNLSVYEVSHPPLGKIIISVGVAIFGMNPFGWRIMGALFGVAMIPLMYAFGKRMFKRPELALLAAGLFAFDFMHFSQTRISTIDVYGVFFNMCMTYYMYKFIKMDLGDSLKDTLIPLGLSGLFFGLGCASKWICIYTGAALAVMFFVKMITLWVKANKIKNAKLTKAEEADPAVANARKFPARFIKTCLFCLLFFIIIPVAIYSAAYRPYYTAQWKPNAEQTKIARLRAAGQLGYNEEPEGEVLTFSEKVKTYMDGVIDNQKYMFSYHSGLNSTHPYQSAWYEWPLGNRPVWFYSGGQNPDTTKFGTISTFGNPAVWWICFAGTLTLFIMFLRNRFRLNAEIFFIFACMASSMLPWMLISRCVFVYHYFATVPMIILASVYVLKHYEDKFYYIPLERGDMISGGAKFVPKIKFIWLAAAIVLFAVFYPVISGIQVSREYIRALEWLPTWTFFGTW